MAGATKDSDTEYVLKKGGSDVPVEPCKSWNDSCEYCDKRFGAWLPEDEEIYDKIPEKPGFFMVSLKTKNVTEVVNISFAESNINKSAISVMDSINDQISNKKSKASKSVLLVRWLVIKNVEDKESIVLSAHWCNNGVLPRFTKSWPNLNCLENSAYLTFSKHLEKWCYAKKDPVWRKPKPTSSKIVEEVKKCSFQAPCEICDSYFTAWQDLDQVIEKDSAPVKSGLVMLSLVCNKKREVVLIESNRDIVTPNIKDSVQKLAQSWSRKSYLQHEKFRGKSTSMEVRWIPIENVDSDNACFLYAHFFNADSMPMYNYGYLPGERQLDKNKHFMLRNHDKKWMYEIEAFKKERFNKQKNKRMIFEELNDAEDDYLEVKTR